MARGRRDYEKAVIAIECEGFTNPHGRVLLHDNFEDAPFKWASSGSGVWAVSRQAAAAYNNSFGVELDVTAALPPAPDDAWMQRTFPIGITKRLVTELFWRAQVIARMQYLTIAIVEYTGTQQKIAMIRYDVIHHHWLYYNDLGAFQYLQGSEQELHDNAINEISLSTDFTTDRYISFRSNNMEINMSALACAAPWSGVATHAEITIQAHTTIGAQMIVHADEIIVRSIET